MLSRKPAFKISIARGALETIFDECDRYDVDETGGRLIGTYHHSRGRYEIQVKGILDSWAKGNAIADQLLSRWRLSGKYVPGDRSCHPEIEHLGSWHTHHVNGYPTLSGGDKTTYFKTVNHEKHNTDFFYALLVVSKNRRGNPRYAVKHFILRRDDDTIYEIPDADITVVDSPALLPAAPGHESTSGRSQPESTSLGTNLERAKDREFFSEFYPGLKPLLSKSVGAPYWKGALTLVDGSRADVVAMENADGGAPYYSIATSRKDPSLSDTLARYGKRQFRSARHAVIDFERELNQALYRGRRP